MTTHGFISLEKRRYAALIEALKEAHYALFTARCFGCGPSDSYVIAARIKRVLEAEEARS